MENLYLLKYNNYYNRIVKRENTLSDYLPYQIGITLERINFNPNDFINTEQIINWDYDEPDYIIVTNEDNDIISRWFVIASDRTRAKQLRLSLHRDLVVDYYNTLTSRTAAGDPNAPIFIEKGTPLNIDDPAIFNNENMGFNQIKKKEILLPDETGCPWIVGFIPRDAIKEPKTINYDAPYTNIAPDETYATLSAHPLYEFSTAAGQQQIEILADNNDNPFKWISRAIIINTNYNSNNPGQVGAQGSLDSKGNISNIKFSNASDTAFINKSFFDTGTINAAQETTGQLANIALQRLFDGAQNDLEGTIEYTKNYLNAYYQSDIGNILEQNNKIIYITNDNKYYKITVTQLKEAELRTENVTRGSNIFNKIGSNLTILNESAGIDDIVQIEYTSKIYQIAFEQLHTDCHVTLNNVRYHLSDSPYDMFCIPYSDSFQIKYLDGSEQKTLTTNKNIALGMANAIPLALGSNQQYDIQLLPYCPVREYIKSTGFDVAGAYKHIIYNESNQPVSMVLWATSSSFTIEPGIAINLPAASSILDKKIENECDIYRLCSPNYNGIFEFNPAKNNGVRYINVDCSYKPFNSYIHLNPDFNVNGLYGSDFNDQRGLVCGGDFSLPQVTSAWANYEAQNKNYQNIFDRQIQNMEVKNNIQKEQEIWGLVSGTLGGVGIGAGAGKLIGGIPGAVVGGALSTGLSLAGGLRDLQLNEQLRSETLDYTKDQFGYQLGNIQALPQSLARTSAFTYNNKIFPFVEYYSCTETEKEALKNKLKYNGYTIMRIGSLTDFITGNQTYIKGKLIRIENIDGDYHIINAIADEINQGVFI